MGIVFLLHHLNADLKGIASSLNLVSMGNVLTGVEMSIVILVINVCLVNVFLIPLCVLGIQTVGLALNV